MGTSGRVFKEAKLRVRVEQDGEALVVRASGELDLSNAKTLEAELRRAIGGDASEVILDLGGVSFIDSAALRGLRLMAKKSLRNGGRLRLLRATTPEERSRFQRLREGADGISHQTNTRDRLVTTRQDGIGPNHAFGGVTLCDFCRSPRFRWRYPGASRGWLACDRCHAAIQAEDRETLLGRVMLAPIPRSLSDRYAPRFRSQARERGLHEQFWSARSGPAKLA
jgi:anti-anti-sigma factor